MCIHVAFNTIRYQFIIYHREMIATHGFFSGWLTNNDMVS
jgi:hypothetical protein